MSTSVDSMDDVAPRRIPTNPFQIQATRELLNHRIESGEISQSDLDLLKSSYRLVSTAAFVGSTLLGAGSYVFMRRYYPRSRFGMRLFVGGSMGMLGSFIGFTVGGVAGAMEVNTKMEDAPRKLQVFAEIAAESRAAVQNKALHRFDDMNERPPNSDPNPSTDRATIPRSFPSTSTHVDAGWDPEAAQERHDELERENEMRGSATMGGEAQFPAGQRRGVGEAKSAWERLRTIAPKDGPGTRGMGNVGGGEGKEDERMKERREFEEMLDKERMGGGEKEIWR